MARTLIENGYLVTMNPARDVHPGGFVVIDGNTIERIGPAGKVPRDEIFDRTLDAGGMIVVPGLINAHQHFYYHLFKGLANGLLLEDWFPQLVFPVADHLTDDDMELTSYLAAIEMLLGGTTCCLHHLRTTTDEKTLNRIVQPTIELGFRQVVGKEIQCRLEGNPDHPRDIAEEMEFVEDLILRWHGSNDEIVQMCLVAECNAIFMDQKVTSEALLIESKRLADRHNLKLATHISGGSLSRYRSDRFLWHDRPGCRHIIRRHRGAEKGRKRAEARALPFSSANGMRHGRRQTHRGGRNRITWDNGISFRRSAQPQASRSMGARIGLRNIKLATSSNVAV